MLETKDAILAHAFKNDSVFATGCGEADVKKWAEEKSGELVKVNWIKTMAYYSFH